MLRRLARFARRHRRGEEVAAEAIGLDLLWWILRRAGLVGATIASAAVYTAVTASHAQPRIPVPQKLALETATQRNIVRLARRYGPGSGIVYVWGGDGPFGFDCSGFVNYVYRRVGISIPRDSRSQWLSLAGRDVRKGRERPGDVVFFHGFTGGRNAGPPPGHVGLYIGDGRFVEYYSSGRPAKTAYLHAATDYMGAKRWWKPITVQKRDADTIFWAARHFHVKIGAASGRSVTFEPWRGRGRLNKGRRAAMVRWAHHNHHATSGNRRRLAVRF